ncbi:MAG: hypothetical protein E6I57_07995 [Chloroflexi bacterium]|nr:MAG: hypothetical protein E6I57_07995 [Chloroflexota bacterium]
MAFVPFWAWQFVIGAVVVLLAITIASTLIGAAMRVPSAFLDDVGKAVSRVAPQPGADVETEDQLKKVITAMPNGKLPATATWRSPRPACPPSWSSSARPWRT